MLWQSFNSIYAYNANGNKGLLVATKSQKLEDGEPLGKGVSCEDDFGIDDILG